MSQTPDSGIHGGYPGPHVNIVPGHDSGDDGDDVNSDGTGVVDDGQSNSSVPSGQSLKSFLDFCLYNLKCYYLKPSHLL